MKYKEFVAWCNERACDGMWGMLTALKCIDVMKRVNGKPSWKREKAWQKFDAEQKITNICRAIDERAAERRRERWIGSRRVNRIRAWRISPR